MKRAPGTGTVVKVSGNRRRPYGVRVSQTVDGKREIKSLGYYATQDEANEVLTRYNGSFEFQNIHTNNLTFSEVYEHWKIMYGHELTEKNLKDYQIAFNLTASIHNRPFKYLHAIDLENVVNNCEKSYSTRRKIIALFNKVYTFANKSGITEKNPVSLIKFKGTPPKVGKPFTNEEILDLWENSGDYEAQNCLILIYTGLRINELLNIKLTNIDLDNCILREIEGSKTEAGKFRNIPIHNDILPIIESRMNQRKWLVEGKYGQVPYQTFYSRFKQRYTDNHRIHDTRHTAISLMDNAGIERHIIKKIVGHSSNDVTDNYSTLSDERLVESINKIIIR